MIRKTREARYVELGRKLFSQVAVAVQSLLPKKKINPRQFQFVLTSLLSCMIWLWNTGQAQAIFFQAACNKIADGANAFIVSLGIPRGNGSMGAALTGFINFIPWFILAIAVSATAFQGWNAYQEYQRDNQSGMIQPVLSILVLYFFLFVADKITAALTGTV